ncbi:MAG: hypothetical protein R3324_03350 [Halobacteriales archaeon]|nr:hypothetical protein [Halobacteriales archaeon]
MSQKGQVYGIIAGLVVTAAIGWMVSSGDIIFTVAIMPIGIIVGSIVGGRVA